MLRQRSSGFTFRCRVGPSFVGGNTKGGGLLPKAQFVEASELAKRVQNDLGKWSGEIDKARAALKRLQQEKAQIGHDFMTGYLKDMAATP